MSVNEPTSIARTCWSAIASLVIVVIWYAGLAATLGFGLLTHDIQGWNRLPYIVWGLWGLPVLILAFLLAVWSLSLIWKSPHLLRSWRMAWGSVTGCLLAAPVWYGTQFVVVFLRQLN